MQNTTVLKAKMVPTEPTQSHQHKSYSPVGILKHIHSEGLGYGLDDRDSIPGRGKEFISLLSCPERLWGLHSFLSNGYQELFP